MKRFNDLDSGLFGPGSSLVNPTSNDDTVFNKLYAESVIEEKINLKSTSFMEMVGTLTDVEYYHIKHSGGGKNYIIDTNTMTDISADTKRYDIISNFKVKFTTSMVFENELDDVIKSYITSGTIIILPRTIKPFEGDMFKMKHLGKHYTYKINGIEQTSIEKDSGFECQFSLYKQDFVINEENVESRYEFHNELVGTTYRPILTSSETEKLYKLRELYEHIGKIFVHNFYDKQLNSFILNGYEEYFVPQLNLLNNNNIDTKEYSVDFDNFNKEETKPYRPFLEESDKYKKTTDRVPFNFIDESTYYDNLLNYFIRENKIFYNVSGSLIITDVLVPLDRVCYLKSIFNTIVTRSVTNYSNYLLSPVLVELQTPGINGAFVGKRNILHLNGLLNDNNDLIYPNLIKGLKETKKYPFESDYTKFVFKNVTSFITDIIIGYTLSKTDDIIDRLLVLHDKKEDLYEHVVKMNNMYYLYPILGYIIEKTLIEKFKDDVLM